MSADTTATPTVSIVVYDRRAVYAMLRDWTPARLRDELAAGSFGAGLAENQVAELDELLTAWIQRALGPLSLRDALLVDRRRGRRVFDLLCVALTSAHAAVPGDLAAQLPAAPAGISALPEALAAHPELGGLLQSAAATQLDMAVLPATGNYPFPDDLVALRPSMPRPLPPPTPPFEQPTGWRRRFAILLATAGVALLVLPLLLGEIPDHPAGLPLALLTLALLVGIKAGPVGFIGALCIWLVANLPGFRHGSSLPSFLWPGLPLMAAGVALLWLDRRVREMWRWLRRQLSGG